ncbi:EXS family-domain-containing protein [Dichotomocladium elegans]|nr:EXS family-domain-containing protein [Dichotomocladium elegans]
MYRSARMWLCKTLGRVLMSFFYPVEFRDFFIADELNSLSYTFWTMYYFVCAYSHQWTLLGTHCHVTHMWVTPFLAALGPWWRFLQCVRRYHDSSEKVHLFNAVKYTTSIAAAFATAIRRMERNPFIDILWILTSMTNSAYTSIWDITQDWGLLHTTSRNTLLRDDLVFPKWIYYVAVPSNVLLRFAWALNFGGLALDSDVLGYLTALLEAYRRIQWNVFRLENEHLNNCADHRAINEIPLPFSVASLVDTKTRLPATSPIPSSFDSTPPARGAAHLRSQRHNASASTLDANALPQPGSFYGRRDFESKRELHHRRKPKRRATDFPKASARPISSAGSSGSDDEENDDT